MAKQKMVDLAQNMEAVSMGTKQPYYPNISLPAEAAGKLSTAKDGAVTMMVFQVKKTGSSLERGTKKSKVHIELMKAMPEEKE